MLHINDLLTWNVNVEWMVKVFPGPLTSCSDFAITSVPSDDAIRWSSRSVFQNADIHIANRYMGALLPRPQLNWLHYCALHITGALSACGIGRLCKMKHLY